MENLEIDQIVETKPISDFRRCSHKFVRRSFSAIECIKCGFGLQDNNRFVLENGEIKAVK